MGYSHGKQWTEKEIVETLKQMVKKLGMDTMPTRSEMDKYFGTSSVSCAVSKHGGTKYFAQLLSLPTKQCESKFGDLLEDFCVLQIQEKLGLDGEKTRPRYPYDILVNRNVKVDVKVSRLFNNYGNAKYHTFNMEKKEQTCDVFVFYCINQNDEIEKTLIIPASVISGKKQLSIGKSSMYDKYIDQWRFISDYNKFMTELQ
jgi:hypothetical protein